MATTDAPLSSNGRTADFESANRGSSPRGGTILFMAAALVGCQQELTPQQLFQGCVAMSRDSSTQDMAAAIKACSVASGMSTGTAKTPKAVEGKSPASPVGSEASETPTPSSAQPGDA